MNDSVPTRAALAHQLKSLHRLHLQITALERRLQPLKAAYAAQSAALLAHCQAHPPSPAILLPEAALAAHTTLAIHGLSAAALHTLAQTHPEAVAVLYQPRRRVLHQLLSNPGGRAQLAALGISRAEVTRWRIVHTHTEGPPAGDASERMTPAARRTRRARALRDQRNRALLTRFRELHQARRLRLDDTLKTLAREFFLSERTVQRLLREGFKVNREKRKDKSFGEAAL